MSVVIVFTFIVFISVLQIKSFITFFSWLADVIILISFIKHYIIQIIFITGLI